MEQPQDVTNGAGGQSRSNVGLGGMLLGWWKDNSDSANAWIMTAAFVITTLGALFSHGNWMATWFAFSSAWFSWRVVVVKKMPPNVQGKGPAR